MGISPEYVLDKMQMYELKSLLDGAYLKTKESWEQTRFISFMTAQVNSTKKLKPTDLLRFSWEQEDTETTITTEDINRLKERSKMIAQNLNKQ